MNSDKEILEKIGKGSYGVPDGYFNDLKTRLAAIPEKKTVNPGIWMRVKPYAALAACFAAILLVVLYRMIGSFDMKSVLWTAIRVTIATVIGSGVAFVLSILFDFGYGMIGGFFELVVCGSIGLVVTFGLCYAFRIPEMSLVSDLVGKVTRRFKRN